MVLLLLLRRERPSSAQGSQGPQPNKLGLRLGKIGSGGGKLRIAIGLADKGGLPDERVGAGSGCSGSEEVTLEEVIIVLRLR